MKLTDVATRDEFTDIPFEDEHERKAWMRQQIGALDNEIRITTAKMEQLGAVVPGPGERPFFVSAEDAINQGWHVCYSSKITFIAFQIPEQYEKNKEKILRLASKIDRLGKRIDELYNMVFNRA